MIYFYHKKDDDDQRGEEGTGIILCGGMKMYVYILLLFFSTYLFKQDWIVDTANFCFCTQYSVEKER